MKLQAPTYLQPMTNAIKAAESLGVTDQMKADIVKIVSADNSPGMLVRDVLGRQMDLR